MPNHSNLPCVPFGQDTRGATYDNFSGQFFRIFEIIICCFVVAICDLVHDVETIHCRQLLIGHFSNSIFLTKR